MVSNINIIGGITIISKVQRLSKAIDSEKRGENKVHIVHEVSRVVPSG